MPMALPVVKMQHLGVAQGLCIGEGDIATVQATHGSIPDTAGKGIANPFAMVQSARMMIEWLARSQCHPAIGVSSSSG
jgi:3-isopropylmalate dehydrogenase